MSFLVVSSKDPQGFVLCQDAFKIIRTFACTFRSSHFFVQLGRCFRTYRVNLDKWPIYQAICLVSPRCGCARHKGSFLRWRENRRWVDLLGSRGVAQDWWGSVRLRLLLLTIGICYATWFVAFSRLAGMCLAILTMSILHCRSEGAKDWRKLKKHPMPVLCLCDK